MYVLDTDHIALLDRGGTAGQHMRIRLAQVLPHDVTASVVSYEEQIRGWMAVIAQARTVARHVPFYRDMERLVRFYCLTPLLPFDAKAAVEFERLRQARIRIGVMDVKIAAIARANHATLLSRNRTDFSRVPGLHVEDWTL